MHRDMLSYNLFWDGKCGMLSTLWSVNMVETTPYHYISYISLGKSAYSMLCSTVVEAVWR